MKNYKSYAISCLLKISLCLCCPAWVSAQGEPPSVNACQCPLAGQGVVIGACSTNSCDEGDSCSVLVEIIPVEETRGGGSGGSQGDDDDDAGGLEKVDPTLVAEGAEGLFLPEDGDDDDGGHGGGTGDDDDDSPLPVFVIKGAACSYLPDYEDICGGCPQSLVDGIPQHAWKDPSVPPQAVCETPFADYCGNKKCIGIGLKNGYGVIGVKFCNGTKYVP